LQRRTGIHHRDTSPIHDSGGEFVFDETVAKNLMARLTERKRIELMTIGPSRDQRVGDAFERLLLDNGFLVTRHTAAAIRPPPHSKVAVADQGGSYVVLVAPAA
jgi:hypothetical protein